MLEYTTYLFDNLDKNILTDSVYTDFQKAFDRIDHKNLHNKIAFNGIRGSLWHWFKSYITNRTQKVVIKGFESKNSNFIISSGVPQGSIIGPLLFVIFVNDVDECFNFCNVIMYADDLKIHHTINNIEECINFQDELHRFEQYCTNNNLSLSIKKCKAITFTKKTKTVEYP